jgi:hypothetical protein
VVAPAAFLHTPESSSPNFLMSVVEYPNALVLTEPINSRIVHSETAQKWGLGKSWSRNECSDSGRMVGKQDNPGLNSAAVPCPVSFGSVATRNCLKIGFTPVPIMRNLPGRIQKIEVGATAGAHMVERTACFFQIDSCLPWWSTLFPAGSFRTYNLRRRAAQPLISARRHRA